MHCLPVSFEIPAKIRVFLTEVADFTDVFKNFSKSNNFTEILRYATNIHMFRLERHKKRVNLVNLENAAK